MRELTVLETCLQRGVLIYFVEQGLARLEGRPLAVLSFQVAERRSPMLSPLVAQLAQLGRCFSWPAGSPLSVGGWQRFEVFARDTWCEA